MIMDDNKLYTMEELCSLLGIGRNTALSLIREQRLKAFKAGKHWLIPAYEVDAYIKNEMKLQSKRCTKSKDRK